MSVHTVTCRQAHRDPHPRPSPQGGGRTVLRRIFEVSSGHRQTSLAQRDPLPDPPRKGEGDLNGQGLMETRGMPRKGEGELSSVESSRCRAGIVAHR